MFHLLNLHLLFTVIIQICISYGSRSNDEWLINFGFVEENNPYDRYEVVEADKAIREFLQEKDNKATSIPKNSEYPGSNILTLTSKYQETISNLRERIRLITKAEIDEHSARELLLRIIEQETAAITSYLERRQEDAQGKDFLSSKLKLLNTLEYDLKN